MKTTTDVAQAAPTRPAVNRIAPRHLLLLALFATALAAPPALSADEQPLQNPAIKRLYSELGTLFRRHYPHVTSHVVNDRIHLEHDTRVFIVHEPLKSGEWQDPWETRGPKPGGILCDVELRKGRYEGAAVVPQTFDKRYFKLLVMAPYSSSHDAHLYVHLSYPANVSGDFLKQFTELVNDFAKYVD